MKVFELTRDQLIELKQRMLFARLDKVGPLPLLWGDRRCRR